ncbi:hypothetical protein [Actinomadura nitritigenes]|uniref:hypothetical protein n=1 Tax=Actinomadura nitritigenes TaxID=134602 RepID=UPI003D9175D4
MRLSKEAIPLGHAWSALFARRQSPLANADAVDLAVEVADRALDRDIESSMVPREGHGVPDIAAERPAVLGSAWPGGWSPCWNVRESGAGGVAHFPPRETSESVGPVHRPRRR